MSRFLLPVSDPAAISQLKGLAALIRKSSNFRFVWQFYEFFGFDPASPKSARFMLEYAIETESCCQFLSQSFDPMYEKVFAVASLHEHARVEEASHTFESTLATAATDRLGAYSPSLGNAKPSKVAAVKSLFQRIGAYHAYQLLPGSNPGCSTCEQHNNHLFSNWFYGVAWDWCILVVWPKEQLLWLGCLTDTD